MIRRKPSHFRVPSSKISENSGRKPPKVRPQSAGCPVQRGGERVARGPKLQCDPMISNDGSASIKCVVVVLLVSFDKVIDFFVLVVVTLYLVDGGFSAFEFFGKYHYVYLECRINNRFTGHISGSQRIAPRSREIFQGSTC